MNADYSKPYKIGTRGYDRRYDPNPLLPMPTLRQMLANQAAEAQRRHDEYFSGRVGGDLRKREPIHGIVS